MILDNGKPLIELEQAIYEMINRIWIANQLAPLKLEPLLVKQARIHSRNMTSGVIPLGHFGFKARIKTSGITFRAAAENVAFKLFCRPLPVPAFFGLATLPIKYCFQSQ
jgi:uncharacterized protein YkwD